jgi:hypothetical protein
MTRKGKEEMCLICREPSLSKDEIGLSKKMLGRQIESFFCLECLADYLNVTTDELQNKIGEFKNQGCKLF